MRLAAFEQAGKARRFSGSNGHRDAVTSDDGGVNPGDAERNGSVIQQKARLEIIGPVQNQREFRKKFERILRSEVGDDSLDLRIRIDSAQVALGCDSLRQSVARVGLVEKRLALQIGEFHKIAVDDTEPPQARPDEEARHRRTQRAAADQDGASPENLFLPIFPDSREEDLSRIFFVEFRFHSGRPGRCADPCGCSFQERFSSMARGQKDSLPQTYHIAFSHGAYNRLC